MQLSLIRLARWAVPAFCATQSIATSLFPPSNRTAHLAALDACNRIDKLLGSPIVQSSGASYDFAATNAWNLENAESKPTCIVFPSTAAHVQTAMKAIYASKSHFAVQAGSHSAMKGWNTVQDGVLIIFSNMQNATYDPVKDSITLQPGVHWKDAVDTLAPYGVAPVGGRVGDVGTGLLLGGGLSFLSPSQGYAADMFKELDVVLVNGDLVTATATNRYSDLFRALKGGANRFGIVTRYELYPVHTGTKDDKVFFGGTIIYNASATEALLNATARYVREVNDSKAVILATFANLVTDGGLQQINEVELFYNGTELPAHIFGDFLAIPATVSQLGPLSYVDVAATIGVGSERGFIQRFGASAVVGNETLFLNAFNRLSNFTMVYKDNLNLTALAITPIPDSQIQAGRARGGNIINPPRGNFAAVLFNPQFKAGIEEVSPAVQQGIDTLFEQVPPSPGLPLYVNECDSKQQVFQSYGDYELLKKTYAKYDPERFNVEHCQGPLGL